MKTLYLHGLDSHPLPEKNEIMREAGLEPISLHINYREKLGVYETLKDTALRKDVEFIIGSSLGGYIGNILAEDLELPCLLFNPAMNYSDVFYSKMPEITDPKCPARYIVLGMNDAQLNPNYTLKHFQEKENDRFDQKILMCHWLGHQIDFRTFREMIHWGLDSYSNKK